MSVSSALRLVLSLSDIAGDVLEGAEERRAISRSVVLVLRLAAAAAAAAAAAVAAESAICMPVSVVH